MTIYVLVRLLFTDRAGRPNHMVSLQPAPISSKSRLKQLQVQDPFPNRIKVNSDLERNELYNTVIVEL